MNKVVKPNLQSSAGTPTGFDTLDPNGQKIGSFDQIAAAIKEIKKEKQSSKHTSEMPDFVGIVLYSMKEPIKKSNFQKMYNQKSNFYQEIIKQSGQGTSVNDGAIISCYCYVPEVSGYFPFPDYKILQSYNQELKKVSSVKVSEEERTASQAKIKSMLPSVFNEYSKIVHHPLFHRYVKSGDSEPSQFEYVNLKFAASLPSMYEGHLISGTSKTWNPAA